MELTRVLFNLSPKFYKNIQYLNIKCSNLYFVNKIDYVKELKRFGSLKEPVIT